MLFFAKPMPSHGLLWYLGGLPRLIVMCGITVAFALVSHAETYVCRSDGSSAPYELTLKGSAQGFVEAQINPMIGDVESPLVTHANSDSVLVLSRGAEIDGFVRASMILIDKASMRFETVSLVVEVASEKGNDVEQKFFNRSGLCEVDL